MPKYLKGQKMFGYQLRGNTVVRYQGKLWKVVGVSLVIVKIVPIKHRYGDPTTKYFPKGVGIYEVLLLGVGRLNSGKELTVYHYIRDHQFTIVRPAT